MSWFSFLWLLTLTTTIVSFKLSTNRQLKYFLSNRLRGINDGLLNCLVNSEKNFILNAKSDDFNVDESSTEVDADFLSMMTEIDSIIQPGNNSSIEVVESSSSKENNKGIVALGSIFVGALLFVLQQFQPVTSLMILRAMETESPPLQVQTSYDITC
jgi:hypothetical protein